jgi:hypothetical protein
MAQEMGRQEQKLGRLMNNGPEGGNSAADLAEILGLLLQLLELLESVDGAGAYTLNSPCNTNPTTGEQLPAMVSEFGPSIGLLPAIVKRLDALAQLQQFDKDLPQPICRGPRPTGEWVTVNFEQIGDGLETT